MKLSVVTTLILAICSSAAFADEIKVEGGGTTIAAVFPPIIKEHFQKTTGHNLSIVKSSAIKGIIALNQGLVDVAAGAHPLDDLIAGAAKEGVKIDRSTMVPTLMTDNKIIAVTHSSNPVKRLSNEQLKGIFTGKITNWKDVDGEDRDIIVAWGKDTVGQNIQFSRLVLGGESVTAKKTQCNDYREIIQRVSETPGAIGIAPFGMTTSGVHLPEIPPLISPVYLITKGAPSTKVQQFIDFYKKEYEITEG